MTSAAAITRIALALAMVGFFLVSSFFHLIGFSAADLNALGVATSLLSAAAWAVSTTFQKHELSAGANITAAAFVALSTGFFYQI
jgi:drug/metabolite transporter (DMT)-like permease